MASKLIIVLAIFVSGLSHAAGPALQQGDLVFHTSRSSQADAIMLATDSKYTHVGVIEISGGQAFVIEAIAKVSRTPLASWAARGRGGHYSVFRYRGLTNAQAVVNNAKSYIGRAYDPFFTFSNQQIYCSELVWLAFRSVGKPLGRVQKVRELNVDSDAVERLVQNRWKFHPLCRSLSNFNQCWSRILADDIVTPASQAEDPRLELVWSNFR